MSKLRSIEVDTSLARTKEYDTAAEAIASEIGTYRERRSKLDSTMVSGARIQEFTCKDDKVLLTLSNGVSLEIFICEKVVDWRILRTSNMPRQRVVSEPSPIAMKWPKGQQVVWDPTSTLNDKKSYPLQGLAAGETFLNLYFKGAKELMFVPVWNLTDKATFLHFSEI